MQGEYVSTTERLIVATVWGRLHTEPFEEGQTIEQGAVIGMLRMNDGETPITSWVHGTFLEWVAEEGEWLAPGRPVALLRALEGESKRSH